MQEGFYDLFYKSKNVNPKDFDFSKFWFMTKGCQRRYL